MVLRAVALDDPEWKLCVPLSIKWSAEASHKWTFKRKDGCIFQSFARKLFDMTNLKLIWNLGEIRSTYHTKGAFAQLFQQPQLMPGKFWQIWQTGAQFIQLWAEWDVQCGKQFPCGIIVGPTVKMPSLWCCRRCRRLLTTFRLNRKKFSLLTPSFDTKFLDNTYLQNNVCSGIKVFRCHTIGHSIAIFDFVAAKWGRGWLPRPWRGGWGHWRCRWYVEKGSGPKFVLLV